ncbi:HAMP domain-containing histidine kinase [Ancylobacter sp. A5.8]|uniref:sensor histidine kinase n=1 Tax=Ancylobacter gelatini TaxID=2919920 RepID=UPI001F4D445A|nr:HAMP domain-containing sensor histidine kinase [Ancylobacter gelatini]MCJ8144703.1 HAMP domain-containing histidine kinase [Ancylobacter gelatini]
MTGARRSRPLGRLVGARIVLFASLAMLAQLATVLWQYGRDPDNLGRLMLEQETQALAAGLSETNGRLGYELPSGLADRYDVHGSGYVARVRTASGVVLFSHCDAACTDHFLPLDVNPPSFWLRRIAVGYPISIAGGRTVQIGERPVFIEIAITGDPRSAVWGVLTDEALEHMLVPMSLTLIFVLGATLLSIRTALRPVEQAARAAETLDPLRSDARLDDAGMPREIAQFTGAVNRSFDRIRELVASQKLFTSAIAHEIRTPLAVIRLELEGIGDIRARRAMAEVDDLTRLLQQLVTLARLEETDRASFEAVGLDDLLGDVVGSLAPWVYAQGATIAFEPSVNSRVLANVGLLKDAIRNLVENAVRHSGVGVAILVASSGQDIAVSDDGRGIESAMGPRPRGGAPSYVTEGRGIGLDIVRRVAALHGGDFALNACAPRGTTACIRLPAEERLES